jgi:hypothetical protein
MTPGHYGLEKSVALQRGLGVLEVLMGLPQEPT